MTTITLSPQLTAALEQAASEQEIRPEKLVEDAVRSYLRGLERDKIKAEAAAFRRLHTELVNKYLGQYVAVHDGKVIDHDQEFQALHQRIRRQFGRQAVLLRQVTSEPERVLVMRSPRLGHP